MKKLVNLIGLVALVSVAAADVSEPYKHPYLPQIYQDASFYKQIQVDPIEVPKADLPDDPMYRPVGGPNDLPGADRPGNVVDMPVGSPNDLPKVDRPGQQIDQPGPMMGPNDLPRPYRPVIRPAPRLRNRAEGVMSEYNKGPGFWLPQPFFRDRLEIDFGPYRGRIKGELKMYDMNGRQVVRQDVFVNGRVMIGEPVASLAPGSYIVEIDCGIDPMFRGKVQKVD